MSLKDLFARPDRNAQLRKAAQETNAAAYAELLRYHPMGDRADPMHDNGQHLLNGLEIFDANTVSVRSFAYKVDATRFDHSSASAFIMQAHCYMAMGCVQAAIKELTPAEDEPLKKSVLSRLTVLYPRDPKHPHIKTCDDPVGLGILMTGYILNNTEFADNLNGSDWAYLMSEAAHNSGRSGGERMLSVVLDALDSRTNLPNPLMDGHHGRLIDSLRDVLSASAENGDHKNARQAVELIDRVIEKGAVALSPEYIDKRPSDSFNTLAAVCDDTVSLLLKRCGSQHLSDKNKLELVNRILTEEVEMTVSPPQDTSTAYSAALSTLLDQQPHLFTPQHVRVALDNGLWGCAEQIAYRAPSITPPTAYGLMMDVLMDYAPKESQKAAPLVQTLMNSGAHKTGHGQTLLDIARHRQLESCAGIIAKSVEAPAVIRSTPRQRPEAA